jgi:hypothetical protein
MRKLPPLEADGVSQSSYVSHVVGPRTYTKAAIDLTATVQKYRKDAETILESQRVSATYSTYSDVVIESFTSRIAGCDRRFAEQGGGLERRRCVCSVLNELAEGNNGLPYIDDWQNIYQQLGCAEFKV